MTEHERIRQLDSQLGKGMTMKNGRTADSRIAHAAVASILLLGLAAPGARGQSPLRQIQFGTSGNDSAAAVMPDGAGGTVVAGFTQGNMGGPNAGLEDVFVARYDPTGAAVWTRQFGTSQRDEAFALCTDGAGGVMVGGRTRGSLSGTGSGNFDAFIARHDGNGNQLWLNQIGTFAYDVIHAIAPDTAGGVFVTGFTRASLVGPSAGRADAFLARYDSAGNQLWIRQFGTSVDDISWAIAADGAGGVVIGGRTIGDLGGTNAGSWDAFIARYDASGARLWLKQFGSDQHDNVWALGVDSAGGLMVGGFTEGDLGGPSAGLRDAFVARYDMSGTQLWLKQFGTDQHDDLWALTPDTLGGVVVSGRTLGDFGAASAGGWDVFVAEYQVTGEQSWVHQFGSSGTEIGASISRVSAGSAVVVGSTEGSLAGPNAGGTDIFMVEISIDVDTDGDGLYDDWELNGIPYIGGAGLPLRYLLPGADPMHKDMYLEVDEMAGMTLSAFAITAVQASFANAPLTNPDGVDGVTLHIVRDESALPLVTPWITDGCWPLDFDAVRAAWYGTAAERAVSDPVALLAAKAKAFRYCILAERSGPISIGGCGNRPGDNIVMYAGTYNDFAQASVLMHELGHNLSLKHGGGDGVNGKPNYPSIMNYVLVYQATWNQSFWRLDYSRAPAGAFDTLVEASLFERPGIGDWRTRGGMYGNFFMPFGVNVRDTGGNTVRSIAYVKLDGSLTDFGDVAGTMFQDGNKRSTDIVQDLNYAASGTGVPFGIPSSPTPGQTLSPYDDWANVSLPLRALLGTGAPVTGFPTDELTVEGRAWIEANFPVPQENCYADCDQSTGLGVLDLFDFLCFQNDFVNGESYACDCDTSTGNGVCDLFDFLCFQSAFVAGCP